MARLGDVCNIKSGYAFKSEMFTKNEIPIIRIGNITENGLEIDNDICFDESFWNKNKNYRINKDDVLVAMSGATVGKSCINKHSNKLLLNQRVASISGKNGVENKYVYYFVSSPAFMDYILEQSVGCAQPNISIKQLCAIEFYLPNLKEQKEIVGKLDKVYNLIALRREQLSKLDELVKARFVELFGDSRKYQKEPLNDNVEQMFIGPFGSALKNEYFVDESDAYCMVYEQKHAIQKTMDLPTRYVNEEKYKELKRFEILGGDIIVSCRGTIGEIYSIPDVAPIGIMHPSIMKIRLKKEKYCNLFFVFMLEEFMRESIKKAKGSGIKMALTATELGKELFVVPPIEKQSEFETFVKQIDKSKFEVLQSLEKLETLKKSLMQQYFG